MLITIIISLTILIIHIIYGKNCRYLRFKFVFITYEFEFLGTKKFIDNKSVSKIRIKMSDLFTD